MPSYNMLVNLSRYEGKTVIRRTVPDSITSWVLTGFSVDPTYGLGLIESPRKVFLYKYNI
jgi:CD109 antigen